MILYSLKYTMELRLSYTRKWKNPTLYEVTFRPKSYIVPSRYKTVVVNSLSKRVWTSCPWLPAWRTLLWADRFEIVASSEAFWDHGFIKLLYEYCYLNKNVNQHAKWEKKNIYTVYIWNHNLFNAKWNSVKYVNKHVAYEVNRFTYAAHRSVCFWAHYRRNIKKEK